MSRGWHLGRCDDCGHPYTTYAWRGRLALSGAVCPVHGTALRRTTLPREQRRIVQLESDPSRALYALRQQGREILAWRVGDVERRPLRLVLEVA